MAGLPILYSSKYWGIVDKPAGVSCHNEPGKDLQSQLELQFHCDVHLVHRLDRETSGILVYALSAEMVPELQKALADSRSKKIYRALLRGKLPMEISATQAWSWPLTDKAEGRKNPHGESAQRKVCLTHVQLLAQNQYFSFVECEIETGRQHQIRKHAAIAKHAIVGDTRYGDAGFNAKISNLYKTDRLFLHSYKLVLFQGNNEIVVESPLPAEFNQLLPISKS